ncbi:MAG: hypothetical protein KTR18_06115 [Acidiferrobacterales bacterium]|nr:hypothetical protein [Acidiferrobacterales bacterium]
MKKFNKKIAEGDLVSRVWAKDPTLWSDDSSVQKEILNRLGWLDVTDWMLQQVDEVIDWSKSVAETESFDCVVVLGMGGSSLAPEVFSKLFEPATGYPRLEVLDSTSPQMVDAIVSKELERTLFVVASKSGTTLETTDLYRYFYQEVSKTNEQPGNQFVAITDKDSWLETHAAEKDFLRVFVNPSDIGGRYSALSFFGIVPAALYGVPVKTLLEKARVLIKSARLDSVETNPSLDLGVQMAMRALSGKDKMMLLLPETMASFGIWVEQLVAESTGKQGRGILPVCVTYPGSIPEHYPDAGDAFNVVVFDHEPEQNEDEEGISIVIRSPMDIGAEFFRWEFATAISAIGLEVNPFDEPNVSEAKQSTNHFIQNKLQLDLQITAETPAYSVSSTESALVTEGSVSFAGKLKSNAYISVLAYLPMTPETAAQLEELRFQVACFYDVACTAGFGPRYLHSTGQLHKGGAPTGAFIQLVETSKLNQTVPGRDYGFAELIRAQADGDLSVLSEKALPVMRIELKGDRLQALGSLASVFADMA